jgi:transposase
METEATRHVHSTLNASALYMALELSKKTWIVALGDGRRQRQVGVCAGDRGGLLERIRRAKEVFGLAAEVPVYSCYEAGRDGFWIHRWLQSEGVDNVVIDPLSIETNRRRRRAKTDRLDAERMLRKLLQYLGGDKQVWSVVRVPTVEEEDRRRLHRERDRLKKERGQHAVRINALLALHGQSDKLRAGFPERVEGMRQWDGSPLPPELRDELVREWERLELARQQKRQLEREINERTKQAATPQHQQVRMLAHLRGVGVVSSWALVMEFFGWRTFDNGKEVGGASGLAGTPGNSGDTQRERGITKTGNRSIRTLMVELAWCWLRHQPDSKLSRWFHERFSDRKRVGIVALARKLLIAFWRYLEHGVVPEGARLKPSV